MRRDWINRREGERRAPLARVASRRSNPPSDQGTRFYASLSIPHCLFLSPRKPTISRLLMSVINGHLRVRAPAARRVRSNSTREERSTGREGGDQTDRERERELVANGGDIPLVAIIFITRQCVKFLWRRAPLGGATLTGERDDGIRYRVAHRVFPDSLCARDRVTLTRSTINNKMYRTIWK